MRAISANVAAVMQSGKQIGDNRPTHEILLEVPPLETDFTYTTPRAIRGVDRGQDHAKWYGQDGWGGGHFVTRADGQILVTYVGPNADGTNHFGNVYLSTVTNEEEIFLQDNLSASNEWIFITGQTRVDSKFLKLASGKILLFISHEGQQGAHDFYYDCYISNNGLGDDFTYLSRVYTYPKTGFNYDMTHDLHVGIPTELPNGRIIFPGYIVKVSWQWMEDVLIMSTPGVFYSDDGGVTWKHKTIMNAGLFQRPDRIKSIAKWGNTLAALVTDAYGWPHTWVYFSYDNGETWNQGELFTQYDTGGHILEGSKYWGWRSAIISGNDGFNYMIAPNTTGSGQNHVYRMPQTDKPPSEKFFYRGTPEDPTAGGLATWEWIAGPWGDDNEEYLWLTEGYNLAYGGTSVGMYGSISYVYGGIRAMESMSAYCKSISVQRSNDTPTAGASIVFDNSKGKLNPDISGTPWHKKLYPGRKIVIKQGYGSELVTTFTGYIDSVNMSSWPQEITIECRDTLKVALDQTIQDLTYKNMKIEDIFRNICARLRLPIGQIDATGLSIDEKNFSWVTYADALDWCSELVAYEFFADEDGKVHFRKPTTKNVIDYQFSEGQDVTRLGYEINDAELHRKVFVLAQTGDDKYMSAQFEEKDLCNLYRVPSKKYMKVDIEQTRMTKTVLQGITQRIGAQMINKVRRISFNAVANPWLQIGDAIKVTETASNTTDIYRILSISISQTPGNFTMDFDCYLYKEITS